MYIKVFFIFLVVFNNIASVKSENQGCISQGDLTLDSSNITKLSLFLKYLGSKSLVIAEDKDKVVKACEQCIRVFFEGGTDLYVFYIDDAKHTLATKHYRYKPTKYDSFEIFKSLEVVDDFSTNKVLDVGELQIDDWKTLIFGETRLWVCKRLVLCSGCATGKSRKLQLTRLRNIAFGNLFVENMEQAWIENKDGNDSLICLNKDSNLSQIQIWNKNGANASGMFSPIPVIQDVTFSQEVTTTYTDDGVCLTLAEIQIDPTAKEEYTKFMDYLNKRSLAIAGLEKDSENGFYTVFVADPSGFTEKKEQSRIVMYGIILHHTHPCVFENGIDVPKYLVELSDFHTSALLDVGNMSEDWNTLIFGSSSFGFYSSTCQPLTSDSQPKSCGCEKGLFCTLEVPFGQVHNSSIATLRTNVFCNMVTESENQVFIEENIVNRVDAKCFDKDAYLSQIQVWQNKWDPNGFQCMGILESPKYIMPTSVATQSIAMSSSSTSQQPETNQTPQTSEPDKYESSPSPENGIASFRCPAYSQTILLTVVLLGFLSNIQKLSNFVLIVFTQNATFNFLAIFSNKAT
uniref:Uncharacterized protein n=1 Tax=Ditylenchus dipsaci TaxID=166011 RepID=A0A915CZS1_9BILA